MMKLYKKSVTELIFCTYNNGFYMPCLDIFLQFTYNIRQAILIIMEGAIV